jgi:peptide/nickel transport system ATP-binding protein
VVENLGYAIAAGRTLGVVGESGCGKTVAALALLRLVPPPGRIEAGAIVLDGQDVMALDDDALQRHRGQRVAMVFQDPAAALNPVYPIGAQVAEAFLLHRAMDARAARDAAVEMIAHVGIPDPKRRAKAYPHQLSGGMRQRAMIAMALALNPALVIADEPTTALDVTVQAQILDLIDRLKQEFNAAVVLITHDLGVVAEHCDDILVMYAGKVVEEGTRDDIYYRSHHPYTWGLLGSIARLDAERDRLHPIRGLPPSLIYVPPGCAFHPRCPYVMDVCRTEVPELLPEDGHHASTCHLALADKERIFREQVAFR